jgi:alpha-galactosidase
MAPAYEKTRQQTRQVMDLFLNQWGIDGLKMDGQHLNAAPPDYDEAHHLASPEQSFEEFPAFYKMIYEEAHKMKPDVIVQNCPCGTCMSVFNMPYMNQAVASDPLNSWQVRLKGKTYKAIIPQTAYFGDHVELSDGRTDFASSFGIGAVLGTKFTWPKENPFVKEDNLLTPEKEVTWRKWLSLYQSKKLSKAEYRGELYDLGYDIPETHVVMKGDTLHYAFYNQQWKGPVELRGLQEGRYTVRDYVNQVTLGEVSKENPRIDLSFEKNLLVEVYPVR